MKKTFSPLQRTLVLTCTVIYTAAYICRLNASAALSGIMAAVFLANKRLSFLKAAGYAALASSCAAAIPMLVREEILVIPSVGLSIFMVLEYLAAYMLEKDERAKEKKLPKSRLKG